MRAAAASANVREIIVIGSQSILGTFPNPPQQLQQSMDADVYPKEHPELSIVIDGAIGELSIFHSTFGYYAHGVGDDTAILPKGWQDRLVKLENDNTFGAIGWCLEVHDLAVSKLVAGREKDHAFVEILLNRRLALAQTVIERLADTLIEAQKEKSIRAWLSRFETGNQGAKTLREQS